MRSLDTPAAADGAENETHAAFNFTASLQRHRNLLLFGPACTLEDTRIDDDDGQQSAQAESITFCRWTGIG